MNDETTVYVNDNPIGETEVYHARKGHVTTLRRHDYTTETTVSEAQHRGLRPCKMCYPNESDDCCPACGYPGGGDDVLANNQQWCSNDDCAVVSFNGSEQ